MSTWARCLRCTKALGFATLSEAVARQQLCDGCGHARVVDGFERDEVVRGVEERVKLLTDAVVMLGKVLQARPYDERPSREQWDALMKELTQ